MVVDLYPSPFLSNKQDQLHPMLLLMVLIFNNADIMSPIYENIVYILYKIHQNLSEEKFLSLPHLVYLPKSLKYDM